MNCWEVRVAGEGMAAPRPFPTPHPVCLPSGCPRFTSLYNKHLPSLPLNACQSTCGIQSLYSGIHVYDKFSGGWQYVMPPIKITKPSPTTDTFVLEGLAPLPKLGIPQSSQFSAKASLPFCRLAFVSPFRLFWQISHSNSLLLSPLLANFSLFSIVRLSHPFIPLSCSNPCL